MSTTKQRAVLHDQVMGLRELPGYGWPELAAALNDLVGHRTEMFVWYLRRHAKLHKADLASRGVPRDPLTIACESCGSPFTAARRDARYCSPRCRQRARRAVTATAEGSAHHP